MIRLSVNINKVATLRNSRGGTLPSVTQAARVCIDAGAQGITVHPRADERHITRYDVPAVASLLGPHRSEVEFNIEGDPRPDLLEMVREVRPHQCTLVPVRAGEVTSQAGWPPETPADQIRGVVSDLQGRGVRVSLFVEPEEAAIKWAASMGAARIELYTEPFAHAFKEGEEAADRSFRRYVEAANLAHALGLGVNAGHDLDLDNLVLFRTLPHLDEVSIGHALISHALYVGLDRAVRDYLRALEL
ncbi:MAG TPA: pyridoxine 5'-phosphate synthase [Vicinamibacterales bacterium]|jgi:pyridoxine 5-phosphate synthase|nr:pyridoxine 5'-phosphate synthase [Vicinamibacterales bacterium]